MKRIGFVFLSLLIMHSVHAEYITNDIVSGCDGMYLYRAQFAIKQITCSSGYYLPANSLSCAVCPSGYTCNGGTYGYNPDIFQGAEYTTNITNNMNNICASNAPQLFRAVFRPHTITINWNDGHGGPSTQTTCTYDGLINLPADPAPRVGYTFSGWKLETNN